MCVVYQTEKHIRWLCRWISSLNLKKHLLLCEILQHVTVGKVRILVEPFRICLPSSYEQKDCFLWSFNHGSRVCLPPLSNGLPASLFVSNKSSKQICSSPHLIIYWHRKTHRQCFLWIVSYVAGQKQVQGFTVWHKLGINLYAWCYDDALAT